MDNNLLNDRISQLKTWEQIESLNEILYNTLFSLHAYNKNRFDVLTQEIREEASLQSEAPVIKVAVCTEENVDKLMFMHPVAAQPPLNSPFYVTTIFVQCDYPTIVKLMRQTYSARIYGKNESFQAQVELKYSTRYLKKMEMLYYAFSENEQHWATVNGRYFYKFLDVYSKQRINQDIERFDIKFGQYDEYISYNKILVWNVALITAPVASCEAKPAYNAIQYEHVIKNIKMDEDQYLVCAIGDRFTSFQRGKEMFIRTYTKQLEQIDLLRIIGKEDAEHLLYLPVQSNQKKPGFLSAIARGAYIPSRGEAERIIHSLGEGRALRLVDLKPLPATPENISRYKGIDFNYFKEDNMVLKGRKLLLFSFETRADKMWAFETMFYVLSELQQYFYEYRCVGEIL